MHPSRAAVVAAPRLGGMRGVEEGRGGTREDEGYEGDEPAGMSVHAGIAGVRRQMMAASLIEVREGTGSEEVRTGRNKRSGEQTRCGILMIAETEVEEEEKRKAVLKSY
eukprot:755109-Hanusia_phi.AAC.9